MNVKEVRARLADIKASAADDEAAHSMEDALYRAVLLAIANAQIGHVEAIQCAALALSADEIEFSRWCA